MKPGSCTAALAVLLGYGSRRHCLRGIETCNHLDGYNLVQIKELADKPMDSAGRQRIPVLDRLSQQVGVVTAVTRNQDSIVVEVTPATQLDSEGDNLVLSTGGAIEHISAALLNITNGVTPGSRWIDTIHPEDQSRFTHLLQESCPGKATSLYYRITDRGYRSRVVRHNLRPTEHGYSGRIEERPGHEQHYWRLDTLARSIYLIADGNELVEACDWHTLKRRIQQLQTQLEEERMDNQLVLCAGASPNACVVCGGLSVANNRAVLGVKVVVPAVRVSRVEVRRLATSNLSMFRVAEPSGWQQLFLDWHVEGTHTSLDVDDNGRLSISVYDYCQEQGIN